MVSQPWLEPSTRLPEKLAMEAVQDQLPERLVDMNLRTTHRPTFAISISPSALTVHATATCSDHPFAAASTSASLKHHRPAYENIRDEARHHASSHGFSAKYVSFNTAEKSESREEDDHGPREDFGKMLHGFVPFFPQIFIIYLFGFHLISVLDGKL
ncbi:threonine synthase [Striga asiatica]|uniref:Threonine synthase n=1 Tax=Striga asiatica TaxID=4170 RepID=A0A5A7PXW7_STRAF|nr:threonine synthase [Striga asiatica]